MATAERYNELVDVSTFPSARKAPAPWGKISGRFSEGSVERLCACQPHMVSSRFLGAGRRRLRSASVALLLCLAACSGGGTDQVVGGDAGPEPGPPTVGRSPEPGSTSAGARGPGSAERVSIRMTVDDWAGIDADMDITGSGAVEDGGDDLPKASKASAIRDLGADQIPWLKGNKWPPGKQQITMTLTRAQWSFVLQEMRGWADVSQSLAATNPEMAEDAKSERAGIARIEQGLASPLKVTPGPKAPGTATRAGTRHRVESLEHQVWLAPFNAYPGPEEGWSKDQLLGISDGAVVVNTGVSWGKVDLTVRTLDAAPGPLSNSLTGWDVGEEDTFEITEPLHVFAPIGLWWAPNAFVPAKPGLYRVRVLASGRIADEGSDQRDGKSGERYEVAFWPVESRTPSLRYGKDALSDPAYEPFSDYGDEYADDEDPGDETVPVEDPGVADDSDYGPNVEGDGFSVGPTATRLPG
jgi:hypothetical protein